MDEQINELETTSTAIDAGSAAAESALKAKRRRWLALIVGGLAAIGIAYAYWSIHLRYLQSTDDAYVGGNIVQITPQIAGTVVAVGADDTAFVKAGQTLVRLDQADAQIALEQAEAQLGRAVREVRSLFATSAQLQATVNMRQSDVAKANEDLARRERLAGSGAISKEEVQHARDAVRSAEAALVAAQQELAANRARVDRTTVENHPDVRNAAAHVHDAYLTYARTALPAPVSGYVAKRSVQLGQRVTPGMPLMAVIPLDQVWVDANFKEAQLATMRVGQPVALTADIYGSKVVYHGRVAGFGAGTGAAFALLPAQNATGNWIKIVQRVPVRIALDRRELAEHPLQIGLSMQVEVDTRERGGERLPEIAQSKVYSTDVFHSIEELADARVRAVIAANEGRAAPHHAASAAGGGHAQPGRLAHLAHPAGAVVAQ
jgi:membrane fusion protein (multidrug efflux system)